MYRIKKDNPEEISLGEILRTRAVPSFNLKDISSILRQVATVLQNPKKVHGILTPERIKLIVQRNHKQQITSMEFSRVETFCKGPGGHFRWYMAPEKLVGSWTTEKSHVWSLGCIVSQMLLGYPLYSGYSDYEIIWKMTQNHGRFPDHLLNGGHKTKEFYFKSQTNHWLLKTPREYGKKVLDVKLVSPDDFRSQQKLGLLSKMEQKQLEHFIDLVKGMLQLDPEKRIPLLQLLRHPFIAGNMDPPRISIGNFKQKNEDTQCAPLVHRGLKRKITDDKDLVVKVSVGKKRRICVEDIPTNVHSSEASQPSPKRINPDLKRKLVSETESESSLPAPKKKRICEEDIPKNPQPHPGDERGPNDKKPLLKRQRSSEDLMPPPKKIKLICDNVPPSSAPVSKAKLDFKSCPSTSTTIQPEKFEEDTSGSPDISFALDSSPTVQTSEVTREPDVSMNGSSTSSGAQLPADDSCGEDLHLKANVQQTETAEDDLDSLLCYFEDDSCGEDLHLKANVQQTDTAEDDLDSLLCYFKDDSCGEDLHLKANVQQTDTAEDDLDSLLCYFEDDSF